MTVYSPTYHAMVSSPATPAGAATAAAQPSGDGESFFHHILDVVNPLQHLPIVGTIYRAITGEHIGPVEKIAGDALYGGMWGAVTAAADVAFESITGKSAEDTVLAWVQGDDKASVGDTLLAWIKGDSSTAIASRKVSAPQMAANTALPSADMPDLPMEAPVEIARQMPSTLDIAAFTSALSSKGIDNDTAMRALYAYRKTVATPPPVVTSLN